MYNRLRRATISARRQGMWGLDEVRSEFATKATRTLTATYIYIYIGQPSDVSLMVRAPSHVSSSTCCPSDVRCENIYLGEDEENNPHSPFTWIPLN